MNILLLYFLLGILCGCVLATLSCCYVLARRWLAGTLRYHEIDSEPNPYLSLDLDKYPKTFKNRKYVLFRVKTYKLNDEDITPQK